MHAICAGILLALVQGPPPARPPVAPASTHGTCTRPDFDGDGNVDRVDAVPDSCGTGGCEYDLYLVRPAGDHFVGRIAGRCSFALKPRRGKALADIVATWRVGAVQTVMTTYRFDGKRYRERSSKDCVRGVCR